MADVFYRLPFDDLPGVEPYFTLQEVLVALDEAVADLEALWALDQSRGKAEERGGPGYQWASSAPALRALSASLRSQTKEG